MGECSRVLKMKAENFARSKNARSGFYLTCKMCKNAENKVRKAAKKRARVEPEQEEEECDDDDEEVISD